MYENDIPPEVFMREVLYFYNTEKKSVTEIARFYDVSETVVKRIIKQYETLKEKPIEFKQVKGFKEIVKELDELKDVERKSTEKITDDDIKDLEIDIRLFEKGKSTEDKGDK